MPQPWRILCLSNGHGEDEIASRIGLALRALGAEVVAVPIVGEGYPYRRAGIEVVGPVKTMPSGGFIYMDWRQTWRDLRQGLGGLVWQQIQTVRQWGPQVNGIVAVGDIVVLAIARLSGAPFTFMGSAKSDYYLRDEQGPYRPSRLRTWLPGWRAVPSDYLPWERWLMRPPLCQGVFPRDQLTAAGLARHGVPVQALGNPMMDGLEPQVDSPEFGEMLPPDPPALLLLPGSRPPEAYHNWQQCLAAVALLPPEILVYGAIAPALDLAHLQQLGAPLARPIHLFQHSYGACLHRADVVLAMAGTATEQCVGLGKPVVSMPGDGPQFTAAFAEAQTRLLGPGVSCQPTPAAAAEKIQALLAQPDQHPAHIGQQRMGPPGAAQRIAQAIAQVCGKSAASLPKEG